MTVKAIKLPIVKGRYMSDQTQADMATKFIGFGLENYTPTGIYRRIFMMLNAEGIKNVTHDDVVMVMVDKKDVENTVNDLVCGINYRMPLKSFIALQYVKNAIVKKPAFILRGSEKRMTKNERAFWRPFRALLSAYGYVPVGNGSHNMWVFKTTVSEEIEC